MSDPITTQMIDAISEAQKTAYRKHLRLVISPKGRGMLVGEADRPARAALMEEFWGIPFEVREMEELFVIEVVRK